MIMLANVNENKKPVKAGIRSWSSGSTSRSGSYAYACFIHFTTKSEANLRSRFPSIGSAAPFPATILCKTNSTI